MASSTIHHQEVHILNPPVVSDFNLRKILTSEDSDGALPHHRNHSKDSMIFPGGLLDHCIQVLNKGEWTWKLLCFFLGCCKLAFLLQPVVFICWKSIHSIFSTYQGLEDFMYEFMILADKFNYHKSEM